jgi:acyl-CoA synthetase (AMP-forming)/AMP-acid ligase II
MDGKSIYELIESEKVSYAAGVPTVWLGLLNHVAANGLRFSTMQRTVIGGSACPPAMIRSFKLDHGVTVLHGWGMTEMSPLGTVCTLKLHQMAGTPEQQLAVMAKHLALHIAGGRGQTAAIAVRAGECLAAAFVAVLGALLLFGLWSAGSGS